MYWNWKINLTFDHHMGYIYGCLEDFHGHNVAHLEAGGGGQEGRLDVLLPSRPIMSPWWPALVSLITISTSGIIVITCSSNLTDIPWIVGESLC